MARASGPACYFSFFPSSRSSTRHRRRAAAHKLVHNANTTHDALRTTNPPPQKKYSRNRNKQDRKRDAHKHQQLLAEEPLFCSLVFLQHYVIKAPQKKKKTKYSVNRINHHQSSQFCQSAKINICVMKPENTSIMKPALHPGL